MPIWSLSNLWDLSICNNKLVGQVLTEIENLRFLNSLSLSDNFLNGMIPDSIVKLHKIPYFNLSNNICMGHPNIFICMLLQDKVLTLNVLRRRGMEFEVECKMCNQGQTETSLHLLFTCQFAVMVLVVTKASLGILSCPLSNQYKNDVTNREHGLGV